MAVDSAARTGESLRLLHVRLAAHFQRLRVRRDQCGHGTPIFALEHGLSEAELSLLKAEVCLAVRRRCLPRESWLPLVIYAAEVGYEYAGEEYWPTFEARTPGWAEFGDRQYIRAIFRDFSGMFGGAEPVGKWAHWFSIISWPITHAVLPTDLQRQLARLLYEYRKALTSELLEDPGALGVKLAARASHCSQRFQSFAQNTSLLGQVAAALLSGDEEESPFLLDSTLQRIIESLSAEREARRWLRDARSSASQIRTHGFRSPASGSGTRTGSAPQHSLPAATDPRAVLRREPGGWAAYLELPDLSVLAERLPRIREDLGQLRARIAGRSRPVARGLLLVPGMKIRLDEWPDARAPLIQVDGGSAGSNGILADQCVLSPGPSWVFRVRDPRSATEVRGKFVRPGHEYIMFCRDDVSHDRPPWLTSAACVTAGVTAYRLDVPALIEPEHIKDLQLLGLGVVTDVGVRPAGLVPANWDGEGAAEWLAGEDAVVAVSSTRTVAQCIFEVDSVPHLLAWPSSQHEIFVNIGGLGVGAHDVRVSLLPSDVGEPTATGALGLTIRAPHSQPPAGTVREGLMLLATPAAPTMTELWDGRAEVQVYAPPGTRVSVDVTLMDSRNTDLARHRFVVAIPVDPRARHRNLAGQIRGSPQLRNAYDDAESCLITVSEPRLGAARLRCERPFTALRWVTGNDHDGPFVRLVDNTERANTVIEHLRFAFPAERERVPAVAGALLRCPAGGLYWAAGSDFETCVILPPHVRNLADFQLADVSPHVETGPQTSVEVPRLIRLAWLWESASLPWNPLAERERRSVLRAVTTHLVGLLAGPRWIELERRYSDRDAPPVSAMQHSIGAEFYHRALARAIGDRLEAWCAAAPDRRAAEFGAMLNAYIPRMNLSGGHAQFGELLLRLASAPALLEDCPADEVSTAVGLMRVIPAVVRAARFVVLAIHAKSRDDGTATYRGWAWT